MDIRNRMGARIGLEDRRRIALDCLRSRGSRVIFDLPMARPRMRLSWLVPIAAVFGVVALLWPKGESTSEKTVHSAHSARDAGPKGPRHKPKSAKELPTTSADIWLENLDGTISELERLVAAKPEILQNVQKLAGAHHM